MIVVDSDGEIITAANGHVSSDNPELVKLVKANALIGRRVRLVEPYGEEVQAELNPENPVGITAALFSARPGRTRLLEAPAEVMDWMIDDAETGEGQSIPDSYSPEETSAYLTDPWGDVSPEHSIKLLLGIDMNNNDGDMK